MPISLRTDDDRPGGNRITLQRFDIPVGEADPALRMTEIHRRVAQVRAERSLPLTQLIAGALNLLPRFVLGEVLLHVDVLASDVPGVPVPVYLGGAAVTEQYAFGPTIGSAVNVTLLSYVDTCAFGVDVDTAAIPDPEVFHACLVEGFDEAWRWGTPRPEGFCGSGCDGLFGLGAHRACRRVPERAGGLAGQGLAGGGVGGHRGTVEPQQRGGAPPAGKAVVPLRHVECGQAVAVAAGDGVLGGEPGQHQSRVLDEGDLEHRLAGLGVGADGLGGGGRAAGGRGVHGDS
ncbi:WS/DGAT domain-containing protein [Mycolicibacterium insubricum]|uniref:WS/DGAT domain-containing protein n=1 Tax=Mycolicibacterium insubricum TaxID=444597 RepID=UPI0027E370BD|nr:WS/DGAT domain-containing protein [Mycolicibacterium insubricum]